MHPLLITAACGQARPPNAEKRPDTPEEVAASVYEAYQAGACIAQIRAPSTHHPVTGRPVTDFKVWQEMAQRIRDRCDILVHFGVAAMEVSERIELLDALRPDVAAFLLGHHDLAVRGQNRYSLRTREDCLRLAQAHLDLAVVPEFEVFHSGATWNLDFVLERVPLPHPIYETLFFGWDGGEWSPPTMEEFLNRLRLVRADTEYTVTTTGPEQLAIQLLAITRGGHVRVGLGDYAYYREGEPGARTAQFVERMVRLADEVGRAVATPAQAREILCQSGQSPSSQPAGRSHAAAHA